MLITAYLGVHVTLHPVESSRAARAYKWGFVTCGIVACALIGIQEYRNEQAQDVLRKQLSQIERNTTEPPKIQVNVPPAQIVMPRQETQGPSRLEEVAEKKVALKKSLVILANELRVWENEQTNDWNVINDNPEFTKLPTSDRAAEAQQFNARRAAAFEKKFSKRLANVLREARDFGLDTNMVESTIQDSPGQMLNYVALMLSQLADKL